MAQRRGTINPVARVNAPDTMQRAAIPVEPQIDREAVRRRAYKLYEHRGAEHGHDWADWFQAERELRAQRMPPRRQNG